MARQRKVTAPSDRSQLVYGGLLLGAVGATLLIGALLRTDRGAPPMAIEAAPAAPAPSAAPTPQAAADPPPPSTPQPAPQTSLGLAFHGDADLADRAAEDERRLHASGNGYTLQFAVVCQPDNARARLERLGGDPDFYLLTTLLEDRVCFRLCWGFYDSERQARAARDVPRALLEITGEPKVLSTREALP